MDRLMPVIGEVLEAWPEIRPPRLTELLRDEHGYQGSVDLVRRCLRASVRGRSVRRGRRVIARGRWCSLIGVRCRPRPLILGVERRIYALIASLRFSGADGAFQL